MKVISGLYKGRNLNYKITGTRPTMDRVKESMFAIIQNKIDDSIVLDLFSGSGALGIEALSNGAKYCYFIDANKKAIDTIKLNLTNLGIINYKVIKDDYKHALKSFQLSFDLIFLDPPYETNFLEESLKLITTYNLLNPNGLIVCESSSLDKIIYPNNYTCVKSKQYGDKYLVILQKVC